MPGDDDAVRHGSFVARRQTFQVAVLSTISRLWVLPQQRFFVPVEFLGKKVDTKRFERQSGNYLKLLFKVD